MVIRQVGSELVDPMESDDLLAEETKILGYSVEELRESKRKDPDLAPVINWLPEGNRIEGASDTPQELAPAVVETQAMGREEVLAPAPAVARLPGSEPTEAELFRQSAETKQLWRCKSQLRLVEGVLYYEWDMGLTTKLKLIVPHAIRNELLSCMHDTRAAGHFGQDKTLERIKAAYYWVGQSRDVALYVATCGVCTRNKKQNRTP